MHGLSSGVNDDMVSESVGNLDDRDSDASVDVRGRDDPLMEFIYQEAIRGLLHQQNVVEGLNTRAGNLIFASAFATSLLGSRALSDGIERWDWVAITLLFGIGILTAFMLWPYYNYTFRFDPEELLNEFVGDNKRTTMPEIHRALALRIKTNMINNWRIIQRIRIALQLAIIFLLLDILAWLLSIARV